VISSIDVTKLTGGCRRTFIALVSILGLFVFGTLQNVDVSATVASIAIALAAANGAEKVMSRRKETEKEDK
jgi:mannose/fructose/N-acetylgalactosamine-specific phosphotransferase system component IID